MSACPERITGITDITAEAPALVIDTQVLLDAVLFHNPEVAPLWQQVQAGALRWLATQAMLDELAEVLRRPFAAAWHAHAPRLWDQARPWAQMCASAPCLAHLPGLRCRDPDDQGFIDLAIHAQAQALVSRDKALLACAAAARARGVQVVTPAHWLGLRRTALQPATDAQASLTGPHRWPNVPAAGVAPSARDRHG